MNGFSKPWLGAASGFIVKMPGHAFTAILGGLDLYFNQTALDKQGARVGRTTSKKEA